MMPAPDQQPTPYGEAAPRYLDAGWPSVIPLPAGRKGPPPNGWTGRAGAWPSRADVLAWCTGPEAAGNLGLRLPDTVVGIDVDAYGAKAGRATLADASARWGALPPTWRVTSRDDGTSGIYLFRVPAGLAWPGEVGPGVEVIQRNHRYVVAWPSIHPDTGAVYRWHRPDGLTVVGQVPTPDELPELPAAWIAGLTGGALDNDLAKADLSDVEATAWLAKHGGGPQCDAVRATVDRYLATRFDGSTSRHDAARDATARLFAMAADGHTGTVAAVNEIALAFRAAFDSTGRDYDAGEWRRLYLGAVRLAAVRTTAAPPPRDPCAVVLPEVDDLVPVGAAAPSDDLRNVTAEGQAPATPEPGVLDVGSLSPAQAAELAFQRQVEAELRVQRARREAVRQLDQEEATRLWREPPSRWTLTDELALPDDEVTWAVDQVLPTGGNVLLAAQYKTGKTTLTSHLARCVADNELFLGRFAPAELSGRVALWNYEVSEGQYRRWLREAGINATDAVAVLNLRGYVLPLTSPVAADWMVRWLAERRTELWVVDPFARAFTGDNENDNTQVARWLDLLDEVKARAGVRELVLATHTGRAQQEAGQERARGATRLDDWADVRWLLTADDDGNRYFRATGRDVEVDEFQLGYDQGTRQLNATGKAGRQVAAADSMEQRVLAVVEENPGISGNGIELAVKGNATAIRKARRALAAAGRVRVEPGPNRTEKHYLRGPSVLTPGVDYED